MLLSDIVELKNKTSTLEALESALKKADWYYEYVDRSKGERKMKLLESMMWEVYSKKPSEAVRLWNTYCPWGKQLPADTKPEFIARLEMEKDE